MCIMMYAGKKQYKKMDEEEEEERGKLGRCHDDDTSIISSIRHCEFRSSHNQPDTFIPTCMKHRLYLHFRYKNRRQSRKNK